jgi:hypothetical protein
MRNILQTQHGSDLYRQRQHLIGRCSARSTQPRDRRHAAHSPTGDLGQLVPHASCSARSRIASTTSVLASAYSCM